MASLKHLQSQCERRNVLIDYTRDFILMMPPLTTTDEDVDVAAGTIAEAIALFREDDIDASTLRSPSVSGRR